MPTDLIFAVLLSWAVTLSGYAAPDHPPIVERVSHAFFVEHACGGQECRVWGWYAGGDRVYIDDRMDPEALRDSSVIVHEMVHYLQYQARGVDKLPCADAILMEREAYGVQREYLMRYGVYWPVGVSMARASCEE